MTRFATYLAVLVVLFKQGATLAQSALPATPPSGIVIQNLRIERIENLTIHIPPGTGRPVTPDAEARPATRDRVEREVPKEFRDGLDQDRSGRSVGLEVHILAMGQANAALVLGPKDAQGKRKSLLIDAGESSSNSRRFRELADKLTRLLGGGRHIDYFVATHFHNDHIGGPENGFAGLVKESEFTFDTVIEVKDEGAAFMGTDRGRFKAFQETLDEVVDGSRVKARAKPQFGTNQVKLGTGVTVDILAFGGRVSDQDTGAMAAVAARYPNRYRDAPASENDLSITMKITYGKFELLTAGDLTGADNPQFDFTSRYGGTYTNVEKHVLRHWNQNQIKHDVEIFCANHHGSKYSNTRAFVDHLDPEFIIYSCGGQHGHPERRPVEEGAETARQFVTSSLSSETWGSTREFESLNGAVVGDDIAIAVDANGEWYWINDELHKAFSDAEEEGDDDRDEEHNEWDEEHD